MLTEEEFDTVIEEALDELPDDIQEAIENLEIMVEDYPPPEIRTEMGLGKRELLGLYTGISLNKRSPTWYSHVLPDRIYLFKKNLEAISRSKEELKFEIQRTILHEIGHYFGLSDRRLRELGY